MLTGTSELTPDVKNGYFPSNHAREMLLREQVYLFVSAYL